MPVLDNPRHEKFAQELAKGTTATEAYAIAGYKPDDGNASKLATKVQARVQEITGKAAARVVAKLEVTVESLIAEVEEARQLALEKGQAAAAVAATREKGVLSGRRVERSEVGKPGDFEAMDDDELEAFIASREGRAGEGIGRKGKAADQKGLRGKSSGLH